ncbi:hypothetical protein ACIP98_41230 [Streptomyces sp. NPDC088354]|uniref:hypothetical protein n=1 Tax=Streptomyces sp. NPDC088354 TaxID=3365856 RepID=UPI0037FA7FA9
MKYALNDKQLEALKLIASAKGSHPVQDVHSGVLWALEQRGLVKTGYAGGRRNTVVTADGRFYIKHGKHPNQAEADKERLRQDPAQAALAPADGAALIARIREAHDVLTIADPGPRTRGRWKAAYYHALHQQHVPTGFALRLAGRDKGDMVLRLIDQAAEAEGQPPAVPAIDVPEDLPTRPHPLIARTLKALGRSRDVADSRGHADVVPIHVSRPLADRALRIAHAVITEAVQRGYEVATSSDPRREDTHRLVIRIGAHAFPWEIIERTTGVPHEPTPQELRETAKKPWVRIPKYDQKPGGRLMITAPDRSSYSTPTYQHSDAKRWTLESRLGHFLYDIETAAQRAEERLKESERQEAARRRHWYRVVREGRDRQVRQHRAAVLSDQVARWREAEQILAFCTAVRAHRASDMTQEEEAWLDWAEHHAQAIDPLATDLGVPPPPSASRHDLRQYVQLDVYAYPWPFDDKGRWATDAMEPET